MARTKIVRNLSRRGIISIKPHRGKRELVLIKNPTGWR
jgi:hypothetical protein